MFILEAVRFQQASIEDLGWWATTDMPLQKKCDGLQIEHSRGESRSNVSNSPTQHAFNATLHVKWALR